MKKNKLYNALVHIYVVATILCTVFFVPLYHFKGFLSALSAVGASSFWIALGLCSTESVPYILRVLLFIWIFAFPVLLIISYIVAKKGKQTLFCITAVIDSAIVLFWYIRSIANNDTYALWLARPDAVISILFSAVLIAGLYFEKKRAGAKTRDGDTGTVLREP